MPRVIKSRWSKRAKRLGTTQTDLLLHSSIPPYVGGLCLTILVLQDPFDQDDWDAYKQFMAEVGKDLSFFCQQIESSAEMTESIICWGFENRFDSFGSLTPQAILLVEATATNVQEQQIVGDDLLVTNPNRIKKALEVGACNALLLKVNQHLGVVISWGGLRGCCSTFLVCVCVFWGCGKVGAELLGKGLKLDFLFLLEGIEWRKWM